MAGVVPVLITTFLASTVEAIEMVTIVVGVGATRGWRSTLLGAGAGFLVLAVVVARIGGAAAVVVVGAVGAALEPIVMRIPRSLLQLVVGILLTTFGSFWAVEGLGVDWPFGDGAILGLFCLYVLTALTNIALERRRVV